MKHRKKDCSQPGTHRTEDTKEESKTMAGDGTIENTVDEMSDGSCHGHDMSEVDSENFEDDELHECSHPGNTEETER